ncbi:MAG: CidA/LrgA family protein [Sphaerochaetaceae bacterium]|nr:CidA/LrgA family protein [Sphaerochaetaceae bacterium]
MPILVQILLFSIVGLAGVALSNILPIPFPASILSMVILFLLLLFRIIRKEDVKGVSTTLVNNMGLFFIVPAISIVKYIDTIGDNLIYFLLISIIATITTFIASTLSIKLAIRFLKRVK